MTLFGAAALDAFALTVPSGETLHGLIHRPSARGGRRPAVVLVPGGVGAGRRMCRGDVGKELVRRGMVVASFNAEGRTGGFGDRKSGGRLNFNGWRDQDGLAEVIRHVAREPDVDPANIGLASVSYGLVAVTGCLARHRSLPIRYVVDEEGPADAWSAMLMGWQLADIGERPDRSQKALELFGHPPPDHPLAGAGSNAEAVAFWGEREPLRYLSGLTVPYLRLQAEYDHVQPPHTAEHAPLFERPPRWWQGRHAMQVVNAAVEAGLPWVRVNLPAQGNPPGRTWTREAPPRWLPGRMTDHPLALAEAITEMAAMPAVVATPRAR